MKTLQNLSIFFKLNISLRFCISSYRSKFLSLGTTGIVGSIILYCGGNARHCRMFSDIPGLHPLDAISAALPPTVITTYHNQKCLQTSPNVLWGVKLAGVRTADINLPRYSEGPFSLPRCIIYCQPLTGSHLHCFQSLVGVNNVIMNILTQVSLAQKHKFICWPNL